MQKYSLKVIKSCACYFHVLYLEKTLKKYDSFLLRKKYQTQSKHDLIISYFNLVE